jgi:hypothetical protein
LLFSTREQTHKKSGACHEGNSVEYLEVARDLLAGNIGRP